MGLFRRGGGGGGGATAKPAESGGGAEAAAGPSSTAVAAPAPPPTAAAAADVEADASGNVAPPRTVLHRRSAESPVVGVFFRPLRPLGPSPLAEARAHQAAELGAARERAKGGGGGAPLLDPPLYAGEHLDAHHAQTRVSRRAEDMLLQRLGDLEHDALAHPPVPEDVREGAARPWRSALRNLPVLLLMAGALAIILAGRSRLHVPEALATVHGVTSAEPYFLPLQGGTVDYLYVLATIAPWYGFLPPGVVAPEGGGGSKGHRRRALLASSFSGSAGAAAAAAPRLGGGGSSSSSSSASSSASASASKGGLPSSSSPARLAAAREVEAAGAALQRAWEAVGYDPARADADGGWRSAALAALRAGERARQLDRRGEGGRRRRMGPVAIARAIDAASAAAAVAAAAAAAAAQPLAPPAPAAPAGAPDGPAAAAAAAAAAEPLVLPSPSRRRSLLAAAPSSGPPSAAAEAVRPRLVLQLVQRVKRAPPAATPANPSDLSAATLPTAVLGAAAYGFEPVGPPQFCALKDGASSKCSVSFERASAGPGAKPGSPLFLSVSLDRPGTTAVDVHARELGGLGRAKDWIALGILVAMLVAIASEKVARMYCAVVASFLMLGLLLWLDLAPDLKTVISWLDESTLGLLFGMMLIVGKTAQTGAFEVMTAATLRLSRGSLALLSVLLLSLTAFLSAWLDNVTTLLLVGPITISLLKTMNADPRPLLVAQVLASNIGGAATLVGDPPNIIIGTALSRHIGFVDFLVHMAPGAILAFAACLPLILWMYRRALTGPIPEYDKVLASAADYKITNWSLFWKCAYVLGIVIVGFLLHPIHHLE
jgi:hypothetical protein